MSPLIIYACTKTHARYRVFVLLLAYVCVLLYDRHELFVTHALCIMVGQPSLTFYYVWHVYTLARACKNETRIWQIRVLRAIHILWLCRRRADVLSDITRFRVRLYTRIFVMNCIYIYYYYYLHVIILPLVLLLLYGNVSPINLHFFCLMCRMINIAYMCLCVCQQVYVDFILIIMYAMLYSEY